MNPDEFGRRLLAWFDTHGRKHLPWRRQRTPYRVWISEIMLQQTQVATVIPYYERFMARFPTVGALAAAPLDDVLHLWSGLGYYARARYLQQAAKIIQERHHGELPQDFAALAALPGVGRSTAGAILALARDRPYPILDGNVKRVLARFHAVEGWPGRADAQAALWELADRYTPIERVADYTQAMMDLGALVCTRRRPRCLLCPVAAGCQAHRQGRETAFPAPRPQRELPVRATRMLLLCNSVGDVLLEQRPPVGVWGGLWSLPECPPDAVVADWCAERLAVRIDGAQDWAVLRHSFSHFRLDITPTYAQARAFDPAVMDAGRFVWYNIGQPDARGLAAPVRRLLQLLANHRLT